MRRSSLGLLLLLAFVSVAHAARPTSAIGDATLANAKQWVKAQPKRTADLQAEIGYPAQWARQFPRGLCVAMASCAIAKTGLVAVRPDVYVNTFSRALRRAGYREVKLADAPAGSIVAVIGPPWHTIENPLHFSVLDAPARGGLRVVESNFPDDDPTKGDHHVQRRVFDGRSYAGNSHPVQYLVLAPPDTTP